MILQYITTYYNILQNFKKIKKMDSFVFSEIFINVAFYFTFSLSFIFLCSIIMYYRLTVKVINNFIKLSLIDKRLIRRKNKKLTNSKLKNDSKQKHFEEVVNTEDNYDDDFSYDDSTQKDFEEIVNDENQNNDDFTNNDSKQKDFIEIVNNENNSDDNFLNSDSTQDDIKENVNSENCCNDEFLNYIEDMANCYPYDDITKCTEETKKNKRKRKKSLKQ